MKHGPTHPVEQHHVVPTLGKPLKTSEILEAAQSLLEVLQWRHISRSKPQTPQLLVAPGSGGFIADP